MFPVAPEEFVVKQATFPHPVYMRLGTSDVWAYDQVIRAKAYDVDFERDLKTIVDAGANVGYSTVYFASKYPRANVYAIEPEASNFSLLKKNTEKYPNVVCINAALWYKPRAIA
jgi:tRNA G46 methylase TrmB